MNSSYQRNLIRGSLKNFVLRAALFSLKMRNNGCFFLAAYLGFLALQGKRMRSIFSTLSESRRLLGTFIRSLINLVTYSMYSDGFQRWNFFLLWSFSNCVRRTDLNLLRIGL